MNEVLFIGKQNPRQSSKGRPFTVHKAAKIAHFNDFSRATQANPLHSFGVGLGSAI
jgi:hypothetical protein